MNHKQQRTNRPTLLEAPGALTIRWFAEPPTHPHGLQTRRSLAQGANSESSFQNNPIIRPQPSR